VGEVEELQTELSGRVAMGFTSQGDKLLVVNQDGFVWQLGFIAMKWVTMSIRKLFLTTFRIKWHCGIPKAARRTPGHHARNEIRTRIKKLPGVRPT